MPTLVLVKNGETVLNAENKFCSWYDSDLSELGKIQSLMAGKKILKAGIYFDIAFTSLLRQDAKSLWLIQEGMDNFSTDTFHDWRLNNRHLGAMEGMNIESLSQEFGIDNLSAWLNVFDAKPPQLDSNDPEFINILNDTRYLSLLPSEIPTGESLLDTAKRTLACWNERVGVSEKQNASVLCVAGESNLRSLVMFLDKLSPDDFGNINIEPQSPIVYELDNELRVMRKSFL